MAKFAVFGFDLAKRAHNIDYGINHKSAHLQGRAWVEDFGRQNPATYEVCECPSVRFNELKAMCPNGDLAA